MAASPAGAASLPNCLTTGIHCTDTNGVPIAGNPLENGGVGGYYGADDLHTHYRFTQTTVTATPQLVDANGLLCSGATPACTIVGTELCDNVGDNVGEVGLWWSPADKLFEVSYEGPGVRNYKTLPVTVSTSDPCVQSGISAPLGDNTAIDAPELVGPTSSNPGDVIKAGDKVYLAVYYAPGGRHEHQISFGMIDATLGWSLQQYGGSRVQLQFTEFGTGALTPGSVLGGGAVNQFETFSGDDVTCYSCKGPVPISSVTPANPFGAGGLYEAQFVNSGSQTVMSPNDSLSGDTFSMWNGSVSP